MCIRDSVNTILVYEADRMGLSQLYQLRGRVGRGARLGYAYLTFMRDKVLTEDVYKRQPLMRLRMCRLAATLPALRFLKARCRMRRKCAV